MKKRKNLGPWIIGILIVLGLLVLFNKSNLKLGSTYIKTDVTCKQTAEVAAIGGSISGRTLQETINLICFAVCSDSKKNYDEEYKCAEDGYLMCGCS